MSGWDAYEHERDTPVVLISGGVEIPVDVREVDPEELVGMIATPERFASALDLPRASLGALRWAHQQWIVRAGLPAGGQARRLLYLVGKVGEELEVDFAMKYPGVPSPRVLWQTRQWRLLLLLIDRLPPNSLTTAALLDDEEYTEHVLDATERADFEKKRDGGGPSLSTWTPEVEALAGIADRLSILIELQKKQPKKPTRYARPKPLLERKRRAREIKNRWKAHEKLVARVIRNPPTGQ